MKKYDLSIVIPVFNEAESIIELNREIKIALSDKFYYEIIYVNDGSTDNSNEIIKSIIKRNTDVKLIDFYNNRGKSEALNSGFHLSSGKIVVTIDSDLQDDPKEIPHLINKINEGYDMVSGWKKDRKDPISKTIPSKFFNLILRFFSGLKIHDFNCGLKAYKHRVVKSINIYGGMHRFIPVLVKENGFSISEIVVNHRERKFGITKYGTSRIFHGLYDFITILFLKKYFNRPLHFFGKYGIILSLIGIAINIFLTYHWFLNIYLQNLVKYSINRPLLYLGVLLVIVGIQFISIGLIGELIVHFSRKNKNNRNSLKLYNFKE